MRTLKLVLVLAFSLGTAAQAWAHGFSLSLSGNTIVATSNDFPGNGNALLFTGAFDASHSDDHGGAGTGLFGTGKLLSVEAVGPLRFSTGGAAALAANNVSLLVEDQQPGFDTGSLTVDRISALSAALPISGNTSHEFIFTLEGAAIPEGVYGFAYRVKGSQNGNPLESSPLLVSTWYTTGFDVGANPLDPASPLSLATANIFAAVNAPEPGSLAMFALGAAGCAGFCWRRRTRKPLAAN